MNTTEVIELTKEGYEEIEKELRKRIDVERPRILEALENARAMGDLSENADYSSARDEQGKNEARIKELEYIIHHAKIVDEKDLKKKSKVKDVKISSTVTYKDLTLDEEFTVRIVSTVESDPLSNPDDLKISNVCPLGIALIGHKVGEVVTVKVNKPYQVEIVKID